MSTGRGYETTLALFMEYHTDRRYGWAEECQQRFGQFPQQIFTEDNRVAHVAEYEGRPGRRPLTYDEVQALFDAVDGRVERVRSQGRKGGLTAMRDAALLKTVYAFGLRRNETRMLDLPDLRRTSSGRSTAVRRSLRALWQGFQGQPAQAPHHADRPGDGLDRRCARLLGHRGPAAVPRRVGYRRCSSPSGLAGCRCAGSTPRSSRPVPMQGCRPEADLHALRHSYITHLVEFDYPEKFVSLQVGHDYASTTAIYTASRTSIATGWCNAPCGTATGPLGGRMIKKMGIRWNLRQLMATREMFKTTDLVAPLAERGVHLSREQVFRLVTQPPQRLSMDNLAALCDILECTPNDLIDVETVNAQVRKTAGDDTPPPPGPRRTQIRRPGQ